MFQPISPKLATTTPATTTPAKTKKDPAIGRPVSKSNMDGFNCGSRENILAAYLGFTKTTSLRHMCLSWPFQKAFIKVIPLWKGLLRSQILEQLFYSLWDLQKVEDPEDKWPVDDEDDAEAQRDRRYMTVCWHILQLKKDILEYGDESKTSLDENRNLAGLWSDQFMKAVEQRGCTQGLAMAACEELNTHPPILGPIEGTDEIPLEGFNRCYEILKYMEHCASKSQVMWMKRFRTIKELNSGSQVKPQSVPIWMREKTSLEEKATEAVDKVYTDMAAEQGPLLDVTVIFDKVTKFPGWEDTQCLIQELEQKGLPLPEHESKLETWDPRWCESLAQFRDAIRRHMNCSELGLNLGKVTLTYFPAGEDDSLKINCTTLNWEYINPHFELAKDSKYTLTVVLREHSVAETYHEASPPPWWRNIREQDAQAQDEDGENQ
jgi:hypothetical protein